MPIIQNGTYFVYQQNVKKRQKKHSFLPFFLFFLSILLVFCTLLAFAKFDFVSIFKMNKYLVFEKKTYYAVSVCSGDREEVAIQQQAIRASGGAGYIYQSEQKFFLLASIYSSFEKANSVVQKLTEYNAEVVEFGLERMILSAEYLPEQLSTLKHVLNGVNRAVDAINEVVACFDRGEILEGEAKQKLQNLANSCQQDKEMLSNAFPSCCDNIVVYAKIFCSQTATNVTATIISTNFSSDAKRLMVDIVTNFADLQQKCKK